MDNEVRVQVNSFPIGIVSRVKRPSVRVELVGEDELVLLIVETRARLGRVWGIRVDELGHRKSGHK